MFLVNSRSYLVSAAPFSSRRKSFTYQRRTFFRSYGAILPSSLTRVLSSALGFSPCPPVSVWGTIMHNLKHSGFSWKQGIDHFAPEWVLVITSQDMCLRICLETLPTRLNRDIQHPADLAFSVPT